MLLSLDADLAKSKHQPENIHDDDDVFMMTMMAGGGDLFWGVRNVRGAQSRQDLSVYWRGEACGERPARGRGW